MPHNLPRSGTFVKKKMARKPLLSLIRGGYALLAYNILYNIPAHAQENHKMLKMIPDQTKTCSMPGITYSIRPTWTTDEDKSGQLTDFRNR